MTKDRKSPRNQDGRIIGSESPDGLSRKRTYNELTMNESSLHGGGVNEENEGEHGDDGEEEEEEVEDIEMMMDPSSLVVEPLPMDDGDDGDGEYDEELIQIQEEAIRRIQRLWRTTNQERRRQLQPGENHRADSESPSKFSPDNDGLTFRSPTLDGNVHHFINNEESIIQQQQRTDEIFLEDFNPKEQQSFRSSHSQQNQGKIPYRRPWYPDQQTQTSRLAEQQQIHRNQQQQPPQDQHYLPYDHNRHQQDDSLPPYYFNPDPPLPNQKPSFSPQPQNVRIDNSIPLSPTMRPNLPQHQPEQQSQNRPSSSSPAEQPDAMEPRTWWDTGDTTDVRKNDNSNIAGRFPLAAQTNDQGSRSRPDGVLQPTNRVEVHASLINRAQNCSPLGADDKDGHMMQSPLQPPGAIIQQHSDSSRTFAPVRNNETAGIFDAATNVVPQRQYLIPYPVQPILTRNKGNQMQRRPHDSRQMAQPRNIDSKNSALFTQLGSTKTNAITTSPQKKANRANNLAGQKRHQSTVASSRSSPSSGTFTNIAIKRSKHEETYILRMNDILEDAERDNHTHVVSWLSHGRAFRIHIPDIFYNLILPKYFSTTKQRSFTRWLRAWGFERQTEGKDRGAWYHRYFIRGVVTTLVKDLTRKQMKAAMEGWFVPGQVPDFYNLSHIDKKLPLISSRRLYASPAESTEEQNQMASSLKSPDVTNEDDDSHVKKKASNNICPVSNPKKLRGTMLAVIRQMLSDADEKKFSHIVSWLGHGKAWKVHKRKEFASEIMSKYFDANELTHISDTLRRWGFQRLKNAEKMSDRNAYYHCLFQRGRPELCRHLTQDQMRQSMEAFPTWKVGLPGGLDLVEDDVNGPSGLNNEDRSMQTTPHSQKASRKKSYGKYLNIAITDEAAHSTSTKSPTCETDGSVIPALDTTLPSTDEDNDQGNDKYVTRIYKMLEDSEREGTTHIVGWKPHGRAFGIYDVDSFTQTILPRYFNASYSSFIRWLRGWGFQRMQGGKDRKCWYHRLFVREATDLVQGYSRQDMLDAMQNWRAEPDFYKSGSESALADTQLTTIRQGYGVDLLPSGVPMTTAWNETSNNGNFRQMTTVNDHTIVETNGGEMQVATTGDRNSAVPRQDPKRLRGSFLEDVRQMLDTVKSEGRDDIVSWQDHGLAFRVHKKSEFSQKILPRFFKSKQYSYFCDVLRTWGFIRLNKKNGGGKDGNGAYFHRLFVRDDPTLSLHLSRNQMKQSMTGWNPSQRWTAATTTNTVVWPAPTNNSIMAVGSTARNMDSSG